MTSYQACISLEGKPASGDPPESLTGRVRLRVAWGHMAVKRKYKVSKNRQKINAMTELI